MDRINSDNIGYDAQGRRIFKDGPPATTLPAQWCTGIQEEMMAVIESEGFAGSVSDNTLLLKSITSISGRLVAAIAAATDNYVTVHDLGTKNIASANSSFNLDLYISGGALAKPSGWKCIIAASNGNGSYFCSPSTTYNIKARGASSAISALNWKIYGTGRLELELDNINSSWNVINSGEWDTFQTPTVAGVYQRVTRYVNRKMRITVTKEGSYAVTLPWNTYTYITSIPVPAINFIIAFSAVPLMTGWGLGEASTTNGGWVTFVSRQTATACVSWYPTRATSASYTMWFESTYEGIEI